ncbi:MAG: 6-carboxytetrahydropterin synthase [Pseudomonadales bacterium]
MVRPARLARIEVAKQAMNFSAAHFTIFSATEREDLHGHNFQLACSVTAPVDDAGLMFDYAIIKRRLRALCDEIDEKMLLPAHSPFLEITDEAGYTIAHFNGERIPFLPRDVLVLPIANTTVEEFSHYFLEKILQVPEIMAHGLTEITVKVSSSPGQDGCAQWSAE